ncbi:ABC transporter substrate-binding protein [Microbacterium sp.]|uniref:ABC transporter substrate-binding protein n=1 Tax=Microbacterium sp. TaxID=51671 RepID=UPI002E364B69|nr:ABC transporter substrate-binding protein [Microbacterium sp.]HEX5731046.1 ABC transporter substrate-binding protein [Microbacterium sp.]
MKMSRFRLSALAVAAAAALTLSACSGDGGGGTASPSATVPSAETPAEGGELTILVAGAMSTWDPGSSTGSFPGVQWDRLYAVYGALLTVNTDGEIEPGLAESLTTEDGGDTWTLTLREGLTFTDGEALDAQAVKDNWDRFADPANNLGAVRVASTFATTVVDETTLEIASNETNPVLDIQIADSIAFIGSPASFPAAGTPLTEPIGAGPFTLEQWDPAVGETFAKNPDYWDEGKPYLDTLTFQLVADPAQRVTSVVQGDAQIMNGYPFQWIADADNPSVGVFPVASGGIRHFVFNTTSDLFSDVRARQAVQLAVNPTELVQTLTQDPAAEGSTALFPDTSPYYDADLALPEQNVEDAQALVDEITGEGTDFTIDLLIAGVPELVRAGELFQLTLQELDGVTVNLTQIPIPEWRAAAYDKDDFDVTFYPGVFDLNSPQVGFGNLFGVGGLDNFANFDDADMTSAISDAQEATTDEDRIAALQKVQEVYVDQVPIVVFGIDYRSFLHGADVVGLQSMGRGALYTDRIGYEAE